MSNTEHRSLAAIMFTDMVGFSALTQRNEALALELLEEHQQLLRAIPPQYQGREIKSTGDGFLFEFPSALAAVQCAVVMQKALADRNKTETPERQIRIRIGIHLGDVVRRDQDVFGDGVNIAARIEPLAEPGGICVTRAVYEQIANKMTQPFVQLSRPELKNIQATVEVYKLVMDGERERAPAKSRRKQVMIALGVVVVLTVVAEVAWHSRSSNKAKGVAASSTGASPKSSNSEPNGQKSVAVLPFVNMSGDKDNEYLSDGITEDVLNGLAKIPGLRVPARTSAFAFKGKNEDIRKIGEMLNVSTVLEGSVQRSGDKLRVTAQLINVADGYHMWSEQFNRDMKDVFAIQDEITEAIVSKLKVTLGGQTEVPHPKHGTENIDAYQHYLKGRFYANRFTRDSLQSAISEFEQATQKQPDYARAYAELAYNYGVMVFFGYASPEEVMPKMGAASEKAAELDDSLAELYILKGSYRLFSMWDWPEAEKAFKHAVELEPENPDTHRSYADFLNCMGRFQEARNEIMIAQKIDPLSEALKSREGWIYYRSGQFAQAIDVARKMVASNPDNFVGHQLFGAALFRSGKRDEGIAEMEKAVQMDSSPMTATALGRMYGEAGKKRDAQRVLQQLQEKSKEAHIPAYCIAQVYEGLGDFDRADEWMNKAIEAREGPLVYLKSDVDDVNRANPHFPEWLKKIGLE